MTHFVRTRHIYIPKRGICHFVRKKLIFRASLNILMIIWMVISINVGHASSWLSSESTFCVSCGWFIWWMEGYNDMCEPVLPSPVARKHSLNKHMHQKEISKRIRHSWAVSRWVCQNKNMTVMSMLSALRQEFFPRMKVRYMFPVTGNSFLPADSVWQNWGAAQNQRNSSATGLRQILRHLGNVHVYNDDWSALDYKAAAQSVLKQQRDLKISSANVIEINGDQINFKDSYAGAFFVGILSSNMARTGAIIRHNHCHHAARLRRHTWRNC